MNHIQKSRVYDRIRLRDTKDYLTEETASLYSVGGGYFKKGVTVGNSNSTVNGTIRLNDSKLEYRNNQDTTNPYSTLVSVRNDTSDTSNAKTGEIYFDADYMHICRGDNKWEKIHWLVPDSDTLITPPVDTNYSIETTGDGKFLIKNDTEEIIVVGSTGGVTITPDENTDCSITTSGTGDIINNITGSGSFKVQDNGVDKLTVDSGGKTIIQNVDIRGGIIGYTDIIVGSGDTLDVSNGTLTLANNQISGDKIDGGTISDVSIDNSTLVNCKITGSRAFTLEGSNVDFFQTFIDVNEPVADKTIQIPNTQGTFCVSGDTGLSVDTNGVMSLDSNTVVMKDNNGKVIIDPNSDQNLEVTTSGSGDIINNITGTGNWKVQNNGVDKLSLDSSGKTTITDLDVSNGTLTTSSAQKLDIVKNNNYLVSTRSIRYTNITELDEDNSGITNYISSTVYDSNVVAENVYIIKGQVIFALTSTQNSARFARIKTYVKRDGGTDTQIGESKGSIQQVVSDPYTYEFITIPINIFYPAVNDDTVEFSWRLDKDNLQANSVCKLYGISNYTYTHIRVEKWYYPNSDDRTLHNINTLGTSYPNIGSRISF